MNVVTGVAIGLLFPVLYIYGGRAWAVLYGAVFVVVVFGLDTTTDLSDRAVTSLLIAFAAAVFLAWGLMRRGSLQPRT